MKKTIYILTALFVIVFGTSQAVKAQEDVGRLLQELENATDRFAKSFDNALDGSEINGTSTEGEVTRYVHEFEDSVDKLKKVYDKKKETKVAAADALSRAKAINTVMNKYKLDDTAQTDWKSVKGVIARLAKAHDLEIEW